MSMQIEHRCNTLSRKLLQSTLSSNLNFQQNSLEVKSSIALIFASPFFPRFPQKNFF